jgi:hypothetical protein
MGTFQILNLLVLFLNVLLCFCQDPQLVPVPSPSKYPFLASVQYRGSQERFPNLTGVILDPNHILTTALQVDGIYYTDYQIVVGELDLTVIGGSTQQIRNVTKLIRNPTFCTAADDKIAHNLAIFRFDEPLVFSDTVQPVRFPPFFTPTTEVLSIVGWQDNNQTTLLQELSDVPLLSASTCRSFIGRLKYKTAHLCVGFLNPDGTSIDSQRFDFNSGSVLLCPSAEDDKILEICGVLSYIPDPPVCQPTSSGDELAWGYPFIFTEASKYLDWIQEVLDRTNTSIISTDVI